jgi:hypothetical protein
MRVKFDADGDFYQRCQFVLDCFAEVKAVVVQFFHYVEYIVYIGTRRVVQCQLYDVVEPVVADAPVVSPVGCFDDCIEDVPSNKIG